MRKSRSSATARERDALQMRLAPECRMPLHAVEVMLAFYAPDEPLGPPENMDRWPDKVHRLRKKYPGFQPGALYREDMKRGRFPDEDAPLDAWIAAVINRAKACWSEAIAEKVTDLQFAGWMPVYLHHDHFGKWSEPDAAMQFLRERYGMPPLARSGRADK